MYYIIYAITYLFSLLPFFILYTISDAAYFLLFRVMKYRKQIVLNNLDIAFPEKSPQDKLAIASKFYRNLTDTFIETIKLISISDKAFSERAIINLDQCNALASKGRDLHFHSGHQMNWEYAHLAISKNLETPWVGIYQPIQNKALDRIYLKIRRRYNAIMVSTYEFKSRMHTIFSGRYALGLVADQNPAINEKGSWLNFFSKAAPFVAVPDKIARRKDAVVVFVKIVKIKRGHYKFIPIIIREHGNTLEAGELTMLFRDFLEENIREAPENYLWSHRRWKWTFHDALQKQWIDNIPPLQGPDQNQA
ncbi:MAG: lipid A biosynthesis acyltransferase [Ferruginibacter sp.]